jgi:hypothetical protein
MDPPELDRFRLPSRPLRPAPSKGPPRPKPNGQFLKGPVPWSWLTEALALPGKAGTVGLVLWFRAGLKRQRCVKFSYVELDQIGVPRVTAWRGLRALEAARLVSVEHKQGRTPEVTILDGCHDEVKT